MKVTGIVRRVDELGRIVIPKEIRRTVKIQEGTPLEIYIDNNMICLKKYSTDVTNDLDMIANEIFDDAWKGRDIYSDKKIVVATELKEIIKKLKQIEKEENEIG
jgi:stage V sporulation protein T